MLQRKFHRKSLFRKFTDLFAVFVNFFLVTFQGRKILKIGNAKNCIYNFLQNISFNLEDPSTPSTRNHVHIRKKK